MPDVTGRWRFAADIAGGISGAFECVQADDDNPFRRHGPLRVSRCRTHLEHADGTEFFLLSDTAWNGALLSTDAEWADYVAVRRSQLFTAVQFVAHAPWRTAPADLDGRVSFRGIGDNFEIIPEAWTRIDRRIQSLNDAGLLAMPVMVWSCLADDPGRALTESNVLELLRYQEARLGANHVVWLPFGDGNYSEDPDRWCRIGREVFGSEPAARQPVAIHPGGQQWPYESWTDHDWYDIAGYQSGHGVSVGELRWSTSGPASRAWPRLARPVINLEPAYEGHQAYGTTRPINAREVRRAIWWSVLLSPVAGVTYGAHGVWSWEQTRREPLNHAGSGEALPWRQAAIQPGATQMRHLISALGMVPWFRLRPDPELLLDRPGAVEEFVAVASTPGREFILAYTPTSRPLELALGRGQYAATWVSPATGQRLPAELDPALAGDGKSRYPAPAGEDWLLCLTRKR